MTSSKPWDRDKADDCPTADVSDRENIATAASMKDGQAQTETALLAHKLFPTPSKEPLVYPHVSQLLALRRALSR